ncbi:GYD domain-containing protein [Planosporangium sp. 12N6]|uniref:GYD domain-containing protein n=1 Tax=Planosporangium spinosum TaxID=3402278 RepID=UPI003CEA7439
MAKYLFQSTYTAEGVRGLLDEGGSGRVTQTENLVARLGGRLESYYFAFGGADVYLVADLPDNTTAAAIGLAVTASGAVRTKTVVLLTPEEIDRAAQQEVGYRPPGAR